MIAPLRRLCFLMQLLKEAYRRHGAEGGMPRPPRFVVLEERESANPGTPAIVPRNELAFPVICKPIEACGEPVCAMQPSSRQFFGSAYSAHGIGGPLGTDTLATPVPLRVSHSLWHQYFVPAKYT